LVVGLIRMKTALVEKFRATFGRAPEIIARAPGRIEFIGNHTDYNGGTVLGAAIDRGVWVALARREGAEWRFASDQRGDVVAVTAGKLDRLAGAQSWVNYPLGILAALPAFGLRGARGLRLSGDVGFADGSGPQQQRGDRAGLGFGVSWRRRSRSLRGRRS
jgi:galactokinase